MERITSSQNPLIRHVRKLQVSRAYREECGEFLAEGWKLLEEALRWYPRLVCVLISQGCACPALPQGTRLVEIPASLMERLSTMRTPQGVIFTCRLPEPVPAPLRPGTLLLDRIQDPGNLGTILRTADAFGVGVALTNGCADPFSEKTVRASMGAVFRTVPGLVPLEAVLAADLPLAVTALSSQSVDLRRVRLRDYVVVIGSEGQGVCPALREAARQQLIIPMQPRCESLNAAVAAAVVLWQMIQ